jgi:hypothetical protein
MGTQVEIIVISRINFLGIEEARIKAKAKPWNEYSDRSAFNGRSFKYTVM